MDERLRFVAAVREGNETIAELCRRYGISRKTNGPPFATRGLSGLSRLSTWWLKLGILPERIASGHPEQNGRHERMHRTMKQETTCPPKYARELQQLAFDTFQDIYNNERPHAAPGNDTPAQHYTPNPRGPTPTPEVDYARGSEVRRVTPSGSIIYRSDGIFLSKSLAGETMLLEPLERDRRFFDVYLADFLIGRIDTLYGTQKMLPSPREVTLPMRPVSLVTPPKPPIGNTSGIQVTK